MDLRPRGRRLAEHEAGLGARVQCLYCRLGEQGHDACGEASIAARDFVCVIEGFATGASVHDATGHAVAAQGLVNVRRDHQLGGPVSLYLLAVADSGERKSTCDTIFSPALRDWESGRVKAIAPDLSGSAPTSRCRSE